MLATVLTRPKYAETIRNMAGVVQYTPLNDGIGTVAKSPIGVNGVYSATGVTYGAGALTMDGEPAVRFNGSPGAVQVAVPVGLPVGSTARTVIAWFRTSSATDQDLVSYGTGATRQSFGLNVLSAGTLQLWTFAADPVFTVSPVATNGQPHMFAVTYAAAATAVIGYYDGVSLGSSTVGSAINTVLSVNGLYMSRDHFQAAKFVTGSVGQVAILNRVLTEADIRHLYAIGAGR